MIWNYTISTIICLSVILLTEINPAFGFKNVLGKLKFKDKYFYFNSCECGLPAFSRDYSRRNKTSAMRSLLSDTGRQERAPQTKSPTNAEGSGIGAYCSAKKKSSHIVVGGVTAEKGEVPWQVYLEDMNTAEQCGGSIVNRLFILTAAHCTRSFAKSSKDSAHKFPHNILVLFNVTSVCNQVLVEGMQSTRTSRVASVFEHPKYDPKTIIYDFALLQLERAFDRFDSNLRPVCLPPQDLWEDNLEQRFVVVSGFGRNESIKVRGKDQTVCNLQTSSAVVLPFKHPFCRVIAKDESVQVCTYEDGKDSCQGDSGGPLTTTLSPDYESKRRFLVGVVSYGDIICARKNVASVNSRVTAAMLWIIARIQSGECA